MYLFLIIFYNTLLSIHNPHGVAVDFGRAMKPILVRREAIEIDVVAKITNVINDFIIVDNVLYFSYFLFGFVVFIFEVCNDSFIVVN